MTKEIFEEIAVNKLWEDSIKNRTLINGDKIRDVAWNNLIDHARIMVKLNYPQVKEYLLMIIEELNNREEKCGFSI